MLKIQCSHCCVREGAQCYASVADKHINVKELKKNPNENPAVILMSLSPRNTFSHEVKLKDFLGGGGRGHPLYWK